jgi:serine protease Do
VGKTAEVGYLRNGQPGTAQVALTTAPEVPARRPTVVDGPNPLNGAEVSNLNPAYAEELGVSASRGAVLSRIDRRSLAARVGFRPEDIILEVNGRSIDNADALLEQLQQRPRGWQIVIDRKGRELSVRLPPVR